MIMKKHHRSVLVLAMFLPTIIACIMAGCIDAQVSATDPSSTCPLSVASLSEPQREVLYRFPRVDSLTMDVSGAPAYLFGDLGSIGHLDPESVLKFLNDIAPLLKSEVDYGYEYVSTEFDTIGQAHIRFQQRINGMPVIGAILIVHVESSIGNVVGLNGHIATGDVEGTAALSAAEAFSMANEELRIRGKDQSRRVSRIMSQPIDEPTLTYILTREGNARLAWRATFTMGSEAGAEDDHTVYADATTGVLLLDEKNRFDLINREVYDFNQQNPKAGPLKLGILVLTEGGNLNNADVETKNVYPRLKSVYDYFKNRLNRNSYDGRDSKIIAVVHASDAIAPAYWDCGTQAAYYMDANSQHLSPTLSLDVVAHEFGHGLSYSTATLSKWKESAMLAEAFSDILGACVEAYAENYTGGGDPGSDLFFNIWSIGEGFWTPGNPLRPLRSLRDPKSCDCVQWQYVDYYPNIADADMYEGTSVASLAFFLLAEGGMHPRIQNNVQVYGLGIPKAEQIFFRALSAYLTPFSDYGDLRQCTHQAARDLYGSKSFEQAQVWYCWQAVGVPSVTIPAAREIANGQSIDSSLDKPGWQYFTIRVPLDQGKLEISASGGFGDADLYVRRVFAPTTSVYDLASEGPGVAKTVRVNNPREGLWYIAVHVRAPIGFSTLVVRYSASSGNVKLYETENNNSMARANRITASNTTVVGRLYKYPPASDFPTFIDSDFFRVNIPAGKTAFITMTSPAGYDYITTILDSKGDVLVEKAEGLGGLCGRFKPIAINNNSNTSKTVYAKVSPGNWQGGGLVIGNQLDPTKDYFLNITW